MVTRRLGLGLIMGSILLLVSGLHASENLASIETPAFVIATETAYRPEPLDRLQVVLGTPLKRGESLGAQLGLAPSRASLQLAEVEAAFRTAQDAFFAGQYEVAKAGFQKIIENETRFPLLALSPGPLRELLFQSHLFQLIIDKGDVPEEEMQMARGRLARLYGDLVPNPMDFPPWLRTLYEQAVADVRKQSVSVVVEGAPNCALMLSGRRVGTTSEPIHVAPGKYVAQVKCPSGESPLQVIDVDGKETRFRPLRLAHANMVFSGKDVLVVPRSATATEADLLVDLLEIARVGRFDRMVVAVSNGNTWTYLLVDQSQQKVIRRGMVLTADDSATKEAALALVRDEQTMKSVPASPKKWYRNGVAYALVGTGLCALGTGIYLGRKYGMSSRQEAIAWALQIGGGGLVLTGGVSFFFPPPLPESPLETASGRGLGLSTTIRF